jgi:colicin import membrane protein
LRPLDSPQDFSCRVKVVQSPKGDVLDVQMIDSCGSALLDRSVENAVRKSSPLPPPPDPSVFDREINIKFRP